jgi:hypothetical protein
MNALIALQPERDRFLIEIFLLFVKGFFYRVRFQVVDWFACTVTRGGAGRNLRPVLQQAANLAQATWKSNAKLE